MPDESRVLTLPMTAAYFRLILRRFGSDRGRRAALLAATGGRDAAEHAPATRDPVGAQLRQLANLHAFARAGVGSRAGRRARRRDARARRRGGGDGAVARRGARLRWRATPRCARRSSTCARTRGARALRSCASSSRAVSATVRTRGARDGVCSASRAWSSRRSAAAWTRRRSPCRRRVRRTGAATRSTSTRRCAFAGRDAAVVAAARSGSSCPARWRIAVAHRSACARLEAMRQRLAGDFVDARVERLLEAGGDAGRRSATCAARLRLSPRTLVRRLGARDTSYRALLDGHRRRRAVELLAQPELSVAEIAGGSATRSHQLRPRLPPLVRPVAARLPSRRAHSHSASP